MSDFIQLHVLTAYPPANLNRDDTGRPKTASFGGANRLRVSSQSLKRAWRTSPVFEESMAGHKGIRTKALGVDVHKALLEKGINAELALKSAIGIAGVFGKPQKLEAPKKTDDDKKRAALHKRGCSIEQLAHISPEEQEAVWALVEVIATEGREPEADELNLLRHRPKAVDIAMFGRMLADKPVFNVEAAVQVAHALTVQASTVEDDYFTAVDDLNRGEEDLGAAHLGETGFGAGLFYLYVCINKSLLIENLRDDRGLADKGLSALLDCVATVAPTGKQNSFASRAYASYVRAERGPQQPRSLGVAFMKPVRGQDVVTTAIEALERQVTAFDQAYGPQCERNATLNTLAADKSMDDLKQFVCE